MAVGSYGIVRPADVSPDDVEILYHYAPNRISTTTTVLKKLTPNQVLTPILHNGNTGGESGVEILGGLYNLKLNATDFPDLGIYTLHIRPKQIRTTIMDCGMTAGAMTMSGSEEWMVKCGHLFMNCLLQEQVKDWPGMD